MNKYIDKKMEIYFAVVLANAVADPLAVMIHHKDTFLTTPTVVVARRLRPQANQTIANIYHLLIFGTILEVFTVDVVAFGLFVLPKG